MSRTLWRVYTNSHSSKLRALRSCTISSSRQRSSASARPFRRQSSSSAQEVRTSYDVVIAGGGVMGCSSAYFLSQRLPRGSVCIVERDTKYRKASSALSLSSIRQQFSIPGNIKMSMFSLDFIKNIGTHLQVEGYDPPDPQFVEGGYLFLATPQSVGVMKENFETQRALGTTIQLLSVEDLRIRFPWLNTEGIELASLGVRNEGWFDAWTLLTAFRSKAVEMGVHYVSGEVLGMSAGGDRVTSVDVLLSGGEEKSIGCRHVVNAAGPWAARVANMAGIGNKSHLNPLMHTGLPVSPRKRSVYVFRCPSGPSQDCPLVVDPQGIYFRREGSGGTFLTGPIPLPENDPDCESDDLEVDLSYFDEHMWPKLASRVSAFEAVKLQNAWAGFYDYNTTDMNGIIGAHPVLLNFVFANGFSGHGLQQSPAVGRAVSEVILDGRTHSLELSDFSFRRFVDEKPILEKNVV